LRGFFYGIIRIIYKISRKFLEKILIVILNKLQLMRLISGKILLAEISPPLALIKITHINGGFEGGMGYTRIPLTNKLLFLTQPCIRNHPEHRRKYYNVWP